MGKKIALCVEEAASRNPGMIGLEGEALDSQAWLDVYTTGEAARKGMTADVVEEFWVVSCDDVEPINLAATVKSDIPELKVCLVTDDACGSLFSRAHTAEIDEVLESRRLPRKYADAKQRMNRQSAKAEAERVEDADPPDAASAQAVPSLVPAPPLGESALLEAPRGVTPVAQFLQLKPRPSLAATAVDGRAFVLTVVSGSGGAGKSAVSALGSLISQGMGNRTLLVDCDLQFGDMAEMLGIESPLCIDDAMAHPDRLESAMARAEALTVLAAPARLEASEEVVHRLPGFLDQLIGAFDVIVVNTGASWAEQHAVLLERSSAALFLVDQRASSVRACRHALELCARCGIATGPFQFALNRCAKGAPLTSIDVSSALQGAPVHELKDGGPDVEDYLSSGSARDLIEMKNEFAKSLEQVMAKLLPGGKSPSSEQATPSEEKHSARRRPRGPARRRGKK